MSPAKRRALGCVAVLLGVLAVFATWWLLATYLGTGDDGPKVGMDETVRVLTLMMNAVRSA